MPGGSAAALAVSSAAMAQANEARIVAEHARCRVVLSTYEPKTAQVTEMRDYAHCVYDIHGDGVPLSGPEVLAVKAAIVIALILAPAGAWCGWRFDGPFLAALLFFGFPLVAAIATGVIYLMGYGVFYLFT